MDNDTKYEDLQTVDEWNAALAKELLADTVCLAFYLIIGVFGNTLVLFVYATRKRLNNEDRFFIPILALVDLIACIVNCPFSISINSLPVKYNSDIACKIVWFLAMYITGSSAFTLMLIAIHRYLKLCKPFGRQMTQKWKKIFFAVILGGMILVALPCFAFYGSAPIKKADENMTGRRCTSVTAGVPTVALVYKTILFLLILGDLVVLVVLYSLIGRLLYKQVRFSWQLNFGKDSPSTTTDSGTLDSDDEHQIPAIVPQDEVATSESSKNFQYRKSTTTADTRLQKHRSPGYRVTVMFMIIAAVFVVCFIPKLIMMIWESRKTDFWLKLKPSELGGYRFLYTFYMINNIVNPFIYGFMDKKFQTELKILCCRRD